MKADINQKLLALENRDLVQSWFNKIHNRTLNQRRTKEINATAKQAREFFNNAKKSDMTVRPLLTFYGVACLSKALVLILNEKSGESSLKPGHGLKTKEWSKILSGDLNKSLLSLGELEVETCKGLFSHLVIESKNRTSIHVRSAAVDWRIWYENPNLGNRFKLNELLSRIPDLEANLETMGKDVKFAYINSISYNEKDGFNVKIQAAKAKSIAEKYENLGYTYDLDQNQYSITCTADIFKTKTPQLLHKYVDGMFGMIPQLFIVEPLTKKENYSEISLCYIISYYLGMLVRYFPTHWVALVHGEKGDLYWPILFRAQYYVENIFPELVSELIYDILKNAEE
ncbi:YaaC family protein [Saccharicrinis sp. FJH62]|uniref:YaaC family protein n=1 Tax=Saccharicrinis sp. FJH62 TaxID=3344657 RepID=UPI0035D4F960